MRTESIQISEFSMIEKCGYAIRTMCEFGSLKTAKVMIFLIISYGRYPTSTALTNSLVGCGASSFSFLISGIFFCGRLTKIGNLVVNAITVFVINRLIWPNSAHVKPRKTMGIINMPINSNGSVSGAVDGASYVSKQLQSLPTKHAMRRRVFEQFFDAFEGWFFHDEFCLSEFCGAAK